MQVEEGTAALLEKFGALQEGTYPPGIIRYNPFQDRVILVNTSIDIDKRNTTCQTKDGATITIFLEVHNQIEIGDIWYTIKEFRQNYEERLINGAVMTSVSQVCAEHSVYEVHIKMGTELGEKIKRRLRQFQEDLDSRMKIRQVIVVEKILPPTLDEQFAKMATASAKRLAFLEERLAEKEMLENERLKSEANTSRRINKTLGESEIAKIEAVAASKVAEIQADAKLYKDRQMAEGDKILFSSETRKEIEKSKTLAISFFEFLRNSSEALRFTAGPTTQNLLGGRQ